MDLLEKALSFAIKAHEGQKRKNGRTPYILHPVEVAAVAATLTDDEEILAAAALHDTVEDTQVTIEDIRREFGDRVAALVMSDTEDQHTELSRAESWQQRKEESLRLLENGSKDIKIMWMSDKLSNMRSFYNMYREEGNGMWRHFNQQDKAKQKWYYATIADLLSEFRGTLAYDEYVTLLNKVFEGV